MGFSSQSIALLLSSSLRSGSAHSSCASNAPRNLHLVPISLVDSRFLTNFTMPCARAHEWLVFCPLKVGRNLVALALAGPARVANRSIRMNLVIIKPGAI